MLKLWANAWIEPHDPTIGKHKVYCCGFYFVPYKHREAATAVLMWASASVSLCMWLDRQ